MDKIVIKSKIPTEEGESELKKMMDASSNFWQNH
jgi:hypothetical protein